jgi:hypothetical protein
MSSFIIAGLSEKNKNRTQTSIECGAGSGMEPLWSNQPIDKVQQREATAGFEPEVHLNALL